MGQMRFFRSPVAALVLSAAALTTAGAAEFTVQPIEIVDDKAVYGTVESINRIEARTRIGGTIVSLAVTEGSAVTQNQVVARVEDPKLALRSEALNSEIGGVEAELANTRADLGRAEQLIARGAVTQQRLDQLRTAVQVAENRRNALQSERAVIAQQMTEGDVLAPAGGRVLRVPVTRGSVVMPGESVASIATEHYVLRVMLPERHAAAIRTGDTVKVGPRGLDPAAGGGRSGRVIKVYPELAQGRVMADVEVAGLGDYFVGERALVRVPVARRSALAVPPSAVTRRHGLDYVRIAAEGGRPIEAVVELGRTIETPSGSRIEVISGLRAGDRVVVQ